MRKIALASLLFLGLAAPTNAQAFMSCETIFQMAAAVNVVFNLNQIKYIASAEEPCSHRGSHLISEPVRFSRAISLAYSLYAFKELWKKFKEHQKSKNRITIDRTNA